MTTCFNFMRSTASATRCGSSSSSAKGFAVVTAQNPHARVQRSPAIIKVAVPWLQHSQRFGHCALSQTVCNRKSEISALVEKKTGLDGNRTLIQGGFCPWCNAGLIFAQDIEQNLQRKKSYKSQIGVQDVQCLGNACGASPRASDRTISGLSGFRGGAKVATVAPIFSASTANSGPIRSTIWVFLLECLTIGSNSR